MLSRLTRRETGWYFGDELVKSVYNIRDIQSRGVHEYPDNPEYGDYFLTTDDWRLRVKVCRVTHRADNQNKSHLETLHDSDCVFYIMDGEGEALLEKDRWAPVRLGDLVYWNAREPHGIRVTEPGKEVWYVSVEGPGPVTIGDVTGRLHSVVGNGAPGTREH